MVTTSFDRTDSKTKKNLQRPNLPWEVTKLRAKAGLRTTSAIGKKIAQKARARSSLLLRTRAGLAALGPRPQLKFDATIARSLAC